MNQMKIFEDMAPEEVPIRALSWWNPFAFLMFHGKVETRLWSTNYRGMVLICSTLAPLEKQPPDKTRHIMFSEDDKQDIEEARAKEIVGPLNTSNLNGFAIGVGVLVDCRPISVFDKTYFHHEPIEAKLYAHVYEDVRRIKPFPFKGSQGWGKVTQEHRDKIKFI